MCWINPTVNIQMFKIAVEVQLNEDVILLLFIFAYLRAGILCTEENWMSLLYIGILLLKHPVQFY